MPQTTLGGRPQQRSSLHQEADAHRAPLDWREVLLASTIVIGTLTALATEALGAFGALDRLHLSLTWTCLFLAAGAILLSQRHSLHIRHVPLNAIGRPATIWLTITGLYALVLLGLALIAPPNTIDSIQYHMSRVAHWAQQRSLSNYATPIERQLYMPPFSEIAVLNLYVLTASDRLVNLVQWSSMIATLAGVSLVASQLRANNEAQAVAVLFAATLPMGILQASSTQNDYVTALWVVCLAHFAVKAHQTRLGTGDWILAGLATGLGVLTKATFYAFALPLLAWIGYSTIRRQGWRLAGGYALLGLALTIVLNIGTWTRNLRTFDTPLGPQWAVSLHANEIWGWRPLVSNVVRSATLNLATPYGDANGLMRDAVVAVHSWIGLDVNDPRTTFGEYRIKRSVNEQYAGYPYHYLLIPVCLLLIWWRPGRTAGANSGQKTGPVGPPELSAYAFAVILGYLLFCALYKWQLTGNRLHLPFYIAWAPVAGIAIQRLRILPQRHLQSLAYPALGILLIVTSIRPLLINPSRPIVPRAPDGISLWNTSRNEILFIDAPEVMDAYFDLIAAARQSGCATFGIAIATAYPEYPLWALLAPPDSGIRLETYDIYSPVPQGPPANLPCAVLCTICADMVPQGLEPIFSTEGHYALYRVPTQSD
jgi:hypothetical protein